MENEEQALAGKKEQGMSYREFELVQEYAKAKLEAQSELQYEDLSDYEIPPRTQFSMLKKPAVSIKYKEITFNMTCVRMFEGITNVLMSLSSNKKRLAVITRKEEGASTVEWSRIGLCTPKKKRITMKTSAKMSARNLLVICKAKGFLKLG